MPYQATEPSLGLARWGAWLSELVVVAPIAATLITTPLYFASLRTELQIAVSASTDYTLVKQFTPARGNQQGLGFHGGTHYIGYDSGDGTNGRIRKYSATGALLSDTGLIRIGHAAELAWSNADSRLYVANGGQTNPTHVYKVNPTSGVIEQDYNFEKLGNNGMVAVDNTAGNMKLFYGPVAPDNNYRIRNVAFDGALGDLFVVRRSLGVPQGIEVVNDRILYLYSKPWGDGSGNHNNWINVYSLTGALLETISLTTLIDESQGLSVDPADNTVYVGAKSPNAVYKLQPAFGTTQPTSQFEFKVPEK